MDVKTPNILLGLDFRAKLADVGLAQALIKQTHLSLHSLKGAALPRHLPYVSNSTVSAYLMHLGAGLCRGHG